MPSLVAHSSGNGVALARFGNRAVEAGFKRGDQRQAREAVAEHAHRFGVGRIMRRRHLGEGLHRGQDRVVDQMHSREPSRMDRLEADGRDFARVVQHADLRIGQLVEAELHGLAVVGDRRGRARARLWPSGSTTLALGDPMRSIAPRASTGSAGSLRSKSRYLKLVLPRLATRTFNARLLLRRRGRRRGQAAE